MLSGKPNLGPALFAADKSGHPRGSSLISNPNMKRLSLVYLSFALFSSAAAFGQVTVPQATEVFPGQQSQPAESNAPPASTQLLASRHFDFITSPLDAITPGSMADTSVSLGEYARRLRMQRQAKATAKPTPNAMAKPSR